METKLHDTLGILLEDAINSGDTYQLFESFLSDGSHLEYLDAIYNKISIFVEGDDIAILTETLPEKESLLSNMLQILLDFIQAYGINETLCINVAKPLLHLAVDEQCSILNIKRAINIFNLLLLNHVVIKSIASDESLEGYLQILGRKVPTIGDYECQAILFEAMYRLTAENREYWTIIWFQDAGLRSMFLNIDPKQFESNCRKALNFLNRHELDRRVFSFIANSVRFGSMQLKEPEGCDFWIDFNYDSQSISFYCSELTEPSTEHSGLWETILISSASVESYCINCKTVDKTKELILQLKCPCHNLIASSNIINPALESFCIVISFWGILDLLQHLEKIYGKDKYNADAKAEIKKVSDSVIEIPTDGGASEDQNVASKLRKTSDTTQVIEVPEGTSEVYSSEILSERKASTLYEPIPLDVFENETLSGKSGSRKKISELSCPIPIDTQDAETISEKIIPQKKVSDLSSPIKIPNHEKVSVSEKISPQRKVSNLSSPFQIPDLETEECIPSTYNTQKSTKVSNSSLTITISEPKIPPPKSKNYVPKSSTSVETIFYDYEVDEKIHEDSESYTPFNNINGSKEQPRKIRLFNLDKAPIYDGSVLKNGKKTSTEDIVKNKTDLSVKGKEDDKCERKDTIPDSADEDKNKSVQRSVMDTPANSGLQAVSEHTQKPAEKCNLMSIYDLFPSSDEDFQQSFNRFQGENKDGGECSQVPLPNKYPTVAQSSNLEAEDLSFTDKIQSKPQNESSRKRRRAAIQSIQKNKKIYDAVSEVEFEKADPVSRSKFSINKTRKKRCSVNLTTDTETGSSDVSWMKQKGSCPLFETPKRNYSDWNKSSTRKRKLPVQGTQPSAKRKRSTRRSKSTSHLKAESKDFTWSDIEKHNLTVEKTTKRGPGKVIEALEVDMRSSDSKKSSSKKSSNLNSRNTPNVKSRHENMDNITAFGETIDDNYISHSNVDSLNKCNSNFSLPVASDNILNINDNAKETASKQKDFSYTQSFESTSKKIQLKNKASKHHKKSLECSEIDQFRSETLPDDISLQPDIEARDSGIQDVTDITVKDLEEEKIGKHMILGLFLDSVTEYTHGSTSFDNENYSCVSPNHKKSNNSVSSVGQSKKRNINALDKSYEDINSGNKESNRFELHQDHSAANLNPNVEECNLKPSKAYESQQPKSFTHQNKKHGNTKASKHLPKRKSKSYKSCLNPSSVEDLCKRLTTSAFSIKSPQKLELKDVAAKTTKELEHGSIKSYSPILKKKLRRRSEDLSSKSLFSLYSDLTEESSSSEKKGRNWFKTIVSALSKETNSLTRKLLGTVQKYVFDYSSKMQILRKHIAASIKVLELSEETMSEAKLKSAITKCRRMRIEVERSLKKIRQIGQEYVEVEQIYYRRIKKKHVKASRKYIYSMKEAEKKATNKLEENVLSQMKFFLKNFLRKINLS